MMFGEVLLCFRKNLFKTTIIYLKCIFCLLFFVLGIYVDQNSRRKIHVQYLFVFRMSVYFIENLRHFVLAYLFFYFRLFSTLVLNKLRQIKIRLCAGSWWQAS
eukprot:TRINITY_DN4700_c0_g1_i3.p3 TRINITY_DN4700_c0_g1~~TRINITY_DN4700_c0_g1_i3.p3  ORF type:complete len:103 (+),score=1.69 TRINITY_DN4700_c0_g1_i3:516-824(+)